MTKKLTDIDIALTESFNILEDMVNRIDFTNEYEFNLKNVQIPWDLLNFSGLYLIEIKNMGSFSNIDAWITDLKNRWEDERYLRKFTPNFKKIRIQAHNELKEWMPLYIGKSKNVKTRIYEHLYKDLNKTTFALKLLARENLQQEVFRLKTIKINVANYNEIVPRIEWQLRNRINPLIGKQ